MTFLAVLAAIVLLAFFFPTSLFGPRLRLRCMCCGRTKDQVAAFISGPRVYICDQCVRDAARAFITSGPPWAAAMHGYGGRGPRHPALQLLPQARRRHARSRAYGTGGYLPGLRRALLEHSA